jgi:hypothetical protein
MITKDSIEQTYCYFHQKWGLYTHLPEGELKDGIKYSISSYVEGMNQDLYARIAEGKANFLTDYTAFEQDMPNAVDRLEKLMENL